MVSIEPRRGGTFSNDTALWRSYSCGANPALTCWAVSIPALRAWRWMLSGNHDHSNGCCGSSKSIKLDVKLGELVATLPRPKPKPRANPVPLGETKLAYYVGVDVGSTTVKTVIVDAATDQMIWSDYQRHETKQPEKVLEFLNRMQADAGIAPNNCRMFITGSGGSNIAPLIG